jgi:hypothetical protein
MAIAISKKLPHYNYIVALFATKKYPKSEIKQMLEDRGLPTSNYYLDKIVAELLSQHPDYFQDNKKTINDLEPEWIATLKIEKMLGYLENIIVPGNSIDGIEGAFKILDDPLMFRLVSSLCIVGITQEDIELMVNGKFNLEYSYEDIDEFTQYFFNVHNWTRVQKQNYIKDRSPKEYVPTFKVALKGDKDYLIWKLGAQPDRTHESMINEMVTDSFYNFKDKTRSDPDLAQKWGTLALKLSDKADKIRKESISNEDFFNMVEFDDGSEQEELVTLDQLNDIEEAESDKIVPLKNKKQG